MSLQPSPPASTVSPERPWLGLRSFSEDAQAYFFGRADELVDLFDRVRLNRLTTFFGLSGLGKSSLLRAGLVPMLRDNGWLPVPVRLTYEGEAPPPAIQILESLREAAANAGHVLPGDAATSTAETLWLLFHDPALGFLGSGIPQPVFIFDQFEEVFTLGEQGGRERGGISVRETLAYLVENRLPPGVRAQVESDESLAGRLDYKAEPARFLISLREDFLYLLERWKRQIPLLMGNRVELELLKGNQALLAAMEPGQRRPSPAPPILTEKAATAIVQFVGGVSLDVPLAEVEIVPSLLSLVCAELNERRLAAHQEQISVDVLRGVAEDILVDFYERTLAAHPPGVRAFVEDRLLSASGFRQPINEDTAIAELRRLFTDHKEPESAARAVLNDLIDTRLLTVEERGGLRRVELAHDILTRVVSRSRRSRIARRELEVAEAARREHEAREEAKLRAARRQSARLRRLVALSVMVTVLCGAAAVFGWIGMQRAASAKTLAEESAREVRKQQAFAEGLLTEAAGNDVAEARDDFQRGEQARAFAHLARSLRYSPRWTSDHFSSLAS